MATQLVLLDDRPATWRLDERTLQIGRHGLAEARRALEEATQRAQAAERATAQRFHPTITRGREPMGDEAPSGRSLPWPPSAGRPSRRSGAPTSAVGTSPTPQAA